MTRADITASICDSDTPSAGSQRERKPSGEQAHAANAHKFAPLRHAFGLTIRSQETMPHAELPATPVRVLTIFLTFSRITLSSFGSPVFWARRELVERQRWLTAQEFVDFLALGQILPGPNILNVTALVGYRFAGWTGAVAAVVGFLGWPFFLVIALGVLHQRYGGLVLVQ